MMKITIADVESRLNGLGANLWIGKMVECDEEMPLHQKQETARMPPEIATKTLVFKQSSQFQINKMICCTNMQVYHLLPIFTPRNYCYCASSIVMLLIRRFK